MLEDVRELKEILEIEKLSSLLERFYLATGLANFIVDMEGTVLHGVGWQSICTEFHRKNNVSAERCFQSDTILANSIKKNKKHSIYICQNGMVDGATPIIIDEIHVGNLFIGQFFFEKPDKDYFLKQAEEFGFDKEKYIAALEACPVYKKETILKYLNFFDEFISMICESALKTIKQKKQNQEKDKRAAELTVANKELVYQTGEKADRAAELVIADEELAFQTGEKADRAAELIIANKELLFQNVEKEKRAAELLIANKKLVKQKGMIEVLNDQLEDRVMERTAQLESANKELESLSYSISHDLKAPLRHIIGYDALLVKKYINLLPADGRQYLENISNATKNMGELIDGLLQFSRTGRIEMNQSILNMNTIVEDYIKPIQEEDVEHRIVFHIGPMPLVFGDLDMMKSVWGNLLENAVKFTRKKELAVITIGAEQTKRGTIFYIKDNGAGFDMSYASKLFTVFQRLHSREDYEGTGIGLATVQRVIARHGGKIWAEAKVGDGGSLLFYAPK